MARYDDILELDPELDGAQLRIGIVMSRFNLDVCEGLLAACTAELRKHGVLPANMLLVTVPGALEIALAAQKMASSARFDAICALGAVIRGETYHFEVVSDQSAAALANVQLDSGVPIANGVLTTDDEDQAEARMSEKGAEVARVAIEMANLLRRLDGQR
ncbi:MAG TPA: 6,7-dimethyl-8-ribityllumazine synthase [Burkholderiales bacterium]|nr:6,7-dimethyl-8-ribityllumazine synthase [Burkholderiales bacterium]